MTDKLDLTSLDIVNENVKKIAELFPNCVTETTNGKAIDFDLLKQELNHEIVEGNKERYRLEWPGKREAIVTANLPTTKTLRPVREDSVDFDSTQNLYIEGDNLEVLKLLQESYLGKIKMIYIDPPYNTGKDFVYKDNFTQDSEEFKQESGQIDEYNQRLVANPETAGRYHSDWLTMMYPRLKLARNLLSEEGVIFISIDDNEIHNLRKLCDEVFGENNFIGIFSINSTPNARDYGHIGKMHEYALFYSKDISYCTTNQLPALDKDFKYADDISGFNIHPLYNSNEAFHSKNRPNLFYPFYAYLDEPIDDNFYKIGLQKKENSIEIYPPLSVKNSVQFVWRWGKEKSLNNLNKEILAYKTNEGEYRIIQKMRHTTKIIRSLLVDNKYSSRKGTSEVETILGEKLFSFPKPLSIIKDFVLTGMNDDDIILDFFSGSATTAHAVMQLNSEDGGRRKFILVQLPQATDIESEAYKEGYKNICEIGKERIRRAANHIKTEIEEKSNKKNSKIEFEEEYEKNGNLDLGFRVFRLAESNMKDVYYRPQDFKQEQLDAFSDNIKPDRTSDDLLIQIMLDWGLPLSLKIEQLNIDKKQVFQVAENSLLACFDNGLNEAFAKEIAKLKPLRVVFKDSSFADNSAKENVKQLLKQLSPETEMKVI